MKSMKLIMEGFKQFIKESADDFFGANFVSFKEDVANGMNIVSAAEKAFGAYIGRGSTRLVFDMGGDFVMKTVNIPTGGSFDPNSLDQKGFNLAHKAKSNEFEKDLRIQQNFPDVFPRAYESAKDFSWLIVEKVEPFKTHEAFLRYLNYHGPFPKEQFIPSRELAYKFVKEEIDQVEHSDETRKISLEESTNNKDDSQGSASSFDIDKFLAGFKLSDDDSESSHTPQVAPNLSIPSYLLPEKVQMAKAMVENPEVKKIIKAAVMLEIPARELKGPNFGISKITNKLVMLDMSLWD